MELYKSSYVWKSGDFYEPTGKFWLAGFGIVVLIGIMVLAAKSK